MFVVLINISPLFVNIYFDVIRDLCCGKQTCIGLSKAHFPFFFPGQWEGIVADRVLQSLKNNS